jgi:hypothetical protein
MGVRGKSYTTNPELAKTCRAVASGEGGRQPPTAVSPMTATVLKTCE